jgi:hypothetical protein
LVFKILEKGKGREWGTLLGRDRGVEKQKSISLPDIISCF